MNHFFLYFKFSIAGLLLLSLVSSFHLHAQGLTLGMAPFLDASPEFESPAIELGLLPDTASYIIVEELYNADTLSHKGLVIAFYNYGDKRVSIEPYRNPENYLSKITTLQFLGDTFCIQVTEYFEDHKILRDSVQAWWQDGLIRRAVISQRYRGRTEFNYSYQGGMLIHARTQGAIGNSETTYNYKNQKLHKVIYSGPEYSAIYEFHHTDTLITITSKSPEEGYQTKTLLQYDNLGRLSSKKTYLQLKEDTELNLYQIEETNYFGNNGFQRTFTQRLDARDNVTILEFKPRGWPEERWTWAGSDQVWLRFRQQL